MSRGAWPQRGDQGGLDSDWLMALEIASYADRGYTVRLLAMAEPGKTDVEWFAVVIDSINDQGERRRRSIPDLRGVERAREIFADKVREVLPPERRPE